MRLTTTARHFEVTPDIVEYLEEKMLKLKRFFDNILHVNVIMSVEKFRHIAEVSIHVNGHTFFAKEESDDMKVSIDKAAENLERQMKKFKGKKVSNHRKTKKQEVYVMPVERIIDSKSIGGDSSLEFIENAEKNVPFYSVEEAILDMENAEKQFVLFNNRDSGKLNLVYRRDDGNYGLIEKFN
ncbi:MAG: ribosomal subunit interface protein [Candidatus Latescibacteria bacterium 4484_7]|nr:MAG: ribosomal subunit interface protein [Candidatus Latescibacteria bacterium 4484_7]RKZ07489.1 MAG: ribosome-associated translation inhibitor RaiA [bacterium]